MQKRLKLFLVCVSLLLTLVNCRPGPQSKLYFNDADRDLLKLGNAYYEIGLSKTNGGITYLLDKTSSQQISRGNQYGCLWTALISVTATTINACAFTPNAANHFSYAWSADLMQLTLNYASDAAAARKGAVTVTLQASQEKWFDLQLSIENHWGYALKSVSFPAGLVLQPDARAEVLLPILPGVLLKPAFFTRGKDYETSYMGFPGVFADYMDFSSGNGSLAVYSTFSEDRFVAVKLGFRFSDCEAGLVCYTHQFQTSAPNNSTWTAPRVRMWVSAARLESIKSFRNDDGLAASPDLKTKLGGLFNLAVQSPLYKADASQLNLAFKDYPALLAQIPYPGILHLLGFGQHGFDRNYPDFLPPAQQYGSTQDLATLFQAAQSRGFLNMPYINPTWWDGESPTMQRLPAPLTVADVAVLTELGGQLEECYGCPDNPHRGIVVSPHVPFVQQRLDQLLKEMKQSLPSDFIFEDQVGARATPIDYNPASPAIDAYTQSWIEHTHTYASANLMTEAGFDALVKSETGFHGSILLQQTQGLTDGYWGTGNWDVYPFATLAARDKVLFYQHNLAPETFTHNKKVLAWNVAMGYNLSYDLLAADWGGGVANDFIKVTGAFQKFVLSHYVNESITAYAELQPGVTQTTFENYSAVVNWDENKPYPSADFILAPSGVLVRADDGSLTAGVFTTYHGTALSSGDHYLIEIRPSDSIMVRQPAGADTDLSVPLQPGWNASTKLEVWAYTMDGQRIRQAPATIHSNSLTFHYANQPGGTPAAFYLINKP
jgi:hypothetical protein